VVALFLNENGCDIATKYDDIDGKIQVLLTDHSCSKQQENTSDITRKMRMQFKLITCPFLDSYGGYAIIAAMFCSCIVHALSI
jgi:hypothetical protein